MTIQRMEHSAKPPPAHSPPAGTEFAVTRPHRVALNEILIRPTAQP